MNYRPVKALPASDWRTEPMALSADPTRAPFDLIQVSAPFQARADAKRLARKQS